LSGNFKGGAYLLLRLGEKIVFTGACLTLGEQDIHLRPHDLKALAKRFQITDSKFYSYPNTCEQFFEKLGFTKTQSLDHSGYEGSSILWDLNEEVPVNLREEFDVIYDGGTLEHVFNFPISLANISRMLKTGGYAIHSSPSSNHVDHGFYMFSPRALYEYYVANSWEIVESVIFEYSEDHAYRRWKFYDYQPGLIEEFSFGGWGNKMLGIFLVARKMDHSTHGIMPQQGTYLKMWDKGPQESLKIQLGSRLNHVLKTLPSIQRMLRYVYFIYVKLRRKPLEHFERF
jgi:hypothetical protein